MLSYLLFVVVSLVNQPVVVEKDYSAQLTDGRATGGLIVKMGPVMNVHVTDVRVLPARAYATQLPSITPKGSLFEGFSKSRIYAIRYGK
jgi:hypothetical protein